jgi:tetratricopeptide (TPR) repeat protein
MVSWVCVAHPCRADDPVTTREAGKHFDRGVVLYGEGDYAGALAEFKRAHALAPNPAVLYDIGQAEYQLKDYAAALVTFRRFLADAPPSSPQRDEVEGNLDVLRTRVGRIGVATVPPGADVTVDDQPIGKTPLADHRLVSVGHRKVTASLAGRPAVTRYVDVAAEDDVSVTLDLPLGPESESPRWSVLHDGAGTQPHGSGAVWRTIGWIATGMLAAGATGAGVLALKESNDLRNARNTYPVSSDVLRGDADLTRTYSIVADSLTIAAVVAGTLTLWATLAAPASPRDESRRSSSAAPGPPGLFSF